MNIILWLIGSVCVAAALVVPMRKEDIRVLAFVGFAAFFAVFITPNEGQISQAETEGRLCRERGFMTHIEAPDGSTLCCDPAFHPAHCESLDM